MTRLPIDTRKRVNLKNLLPKGNIHAVNAYKEGKLVNGPSYADFVEDEI